MFASNFYIKNILHCFIVAISIHSFVIAVSIPKPCKHLNFVDNISGSLSLKSHNYFNNVDSFQIKYFSLLYQLLVHFGMCDSRFNRTRTKLYRSTVNDVNLALSGPLNSTHCNNTDKNAWMEVFLFPPTTYVACIFCLFAR